MDNENFEASVGMSRKWNAREAGREVAENTIKNLNHDPSFFLLFSTIHYEKHEGFQEFFNGVWEVMPEGTPLVGGTVAGFMNNFGCYTRGATAIGVYSDSADVINDVAINTKRMPKKTAKKIISKIKKNYNGEKGILFEFLAGPTIPEIPIMGKTNLVKSKMLSLFFRYFGIRLSSIFGYGVSKGSIILGEIQKSFPDIKIIGGATMDDGKLIRNYQFCKNKVYKNSVTFLYFKSDNDFDLDGVLELGISDISFEVTKTSNNCTVLEKLDGITAVDAFFNKINKEDYPLKSKDLLYRATMSYPIVSDDQVSSTGIGAIYGDSILLGHPITEKRIFLLRSSGKYLLDMTEKLKPTMIGKDMLLGSMCETCVDMLGNKLYEQKRIIDEIAQKTPYILPYFAGEHYASGKNLHVRSHSLNILGVK